MDRRWYLRFALVVGVVGLAGFHLYPSYVYYSEMSAEQRDDHAAFCSALPSFFPCAKFNLGLDLQGGVHLVMGVDVDAAVAQRADRLADDVRDGLAEQTAEGKLASFEVFRPRDSDEIEIKAETAADAEAAGRWIRKQFSVLARSETRQGNVWVYRLLEDEAAFVRSSALDQAIKTIRNRADKLGVSEPTIARRGTSNILIQLPGVKDPERAIALIGKTAQLEFSIVEEAATAAFAGIASEDLPEGVRREETTVAGPSGNQTEIFFQVPESRMPEMRTILEDTLGSAYRVAFSAPGPENGAASAEEGAEAIFRSYVLRARPGITGDYLTDARVAQNPDLPADYFVSMDFDTKGAKIFAKLTEESIQRRMAIVLDGRVTSAPVIQDRIGGGSARITLGRGGRAQDRFREAQDLTLVLKAGALPAPVEIREKRQVGQSLGKESVAQGARAILLGALLVVLFMLGRYRASGMVANFALLLNVGLVLAVLAAFEATLTLPGMAGIVLTIGMAVDANVIIFERIKEELALGKSPRSAIDAGYGKAFATILDANVTTLIAGVVLMQYGSGPVRGFAVTLIVGILCSMFTAVVVTRLVYDFFTRWRRLRTLSI